MARTPHGYYDFATIERDLKTWRVPCVTPHRYGCGTQSGDISAGPCVAYCQGTPLRNEIEARDKSRLGEATDIAAEAIAKRFGPGSVDGKIQAHAVTIEC